MEMILLRILVSQLWVLALSGVTVSCLPLQRVAISVSGNMLLLLLVGGGWRAREASWVGYDFTMPWGGPKGQRSNRHRHTYKRCNRLQHCHIVCVFDPWLCGPSRGLKWARLPGVARGLQAVSHDCRSKPVCLTCTTVHVYVQMYNPCMRDHLLYQPLLMLNPLWKATIILTKRKAG